MKIEYRQIHPNEHLNFFKVEARGFGGHYAPTKNQRAADKKRLTPEMTLAAFENKQLVGTSAAEPFETTVPGGGFVKNAGVAFVTVETTHKRRGILTEMMKKLLARERDNGMVVASLWASESIIYGRFGYGMAIRAEDLKIEKNKVRLEYTPQIPGSLKIVPDKEIRKTLQLAWNRAVKNHVGIPRLNNASWDIYMSDKENSSRTDAWSKPFTVAYYEQGSPHGYATYKTTKIRGTNKILDKRIIQATEIIHSSPASHAALWSHLLNIDFNDEIITRRAHADDALSWMLSDARQLQRSPYDGVWYRLLDVAEALAKRKYMNNGNLVFDVIDCFIPKWGGRFELNGGASGATCNASTKSPDITLTTAALAACYLGGISFRVLEQAGHIQENKDGAIKTADTMFPTTITPWCPLDF